MRGSLLICNAITVGLNMTVIIYVCIVKNCEHILSSTFALASSQPWSLSCRIGLQCSKLRFPVEVARSLELEGSTAHCMPSRDGEVAEATAGSRGRIIHLEGASSAPGDKEGTDGGLMVIAGAPWWRCLGP